MDKVKARQRAALLQARITEWGKAATICQEFRMRREERTYRDAIEDAQFELDDLRRVWL